MESNKRNQLIKNIISKYTANEALEKGRIIKTQNSEGNVKYLAAIEIENNVYAIPSEGDIFEYVGQNGIGSYQGQYTQKFLGDEYRPTGVASLVDTLALYSFNSIVINDLEKATEKINSHKEYKVIADRLFSEYYDFPIRYRKR